MISSFEIFLETDHCVEGLLQMMEDYKEEPETFLECSAKFIDSSPNSSVVGGEDYDEGKNNGTLVWYNDGYVFLETHSESTQRFELTLFYIPGMNSGVWAVGQPLLHF